MDTTIAILAGGKATRLYPKTLEIPKSMIEVAGKPFISHQLELLNRKGIKKAVLCLGNLHEEIVNYVGDGAKFGIDVQYSYDGDSLVGTGGAIMNAVEMLSDPFMVMYGDSYLNIDFIDIIEYFKSQPCPGLMTVLKNDDMWDKSNIDFRNGKIVKYEKNSGGSFSYIDFGLSMLRKEVLKGRKKNTSFDLNEVFKTLIAKDELAGFEVKERFYEIGSFNGIEETEKYILSLNL